MKTKYITGDELNKYIVSPDITIVDAMKKIDAICGQALVVVDEGNKLLGCASDGDIRRSLIADGKMDKPISKIMNRKPKYIRQGEESDRMWNRFADYHMLPSTDERMRVCGINLKHEPVVTQVESELLRDVPVVIMAGGKGTRLYPFTKILPKPLIPIGEVPILERIIDRYSSYGMHDFYLTVNYKKGMIRSYFDELNPDYNVHYVEEDKPLGTAGSLKLIKQKFDKPIIVANCDILIEADYDDIYRQHIESGSAITIVSALKYISVPYGVLHTEEGGVITSMEEKPNLSYFINTGMYILNPEYIDEIPDDVMFHMPSLAEKLMAKGLKVTMYPVSEDSFLDMGEFEEMRRMEERLDVVGSE